MTREFTGFGFWLSMGILPLSCAKVTTTIPDFDGGTIGAAGNTGSGGTSSAIVTSISTSTGGAAATGGFRATGGVPAVATGGTPSVSTGGVASTAGGATAATGGTKAATGGVPGTGGAPATGGVNAGDAGTNCASGYAFCDNFETGSAAQWTGSTGTWTVVTDTTEVAGDQLVYASPATNAVSKAGTGVYANASIESRVRVMSFSSTSASNAVGIFLRSNGTNDYDLSLGGDGKIYLRRDPGSSTEESCTSGTTNAASGVTINPTTACASGKTCTGWLRLKLTVTGTVAAGITITGYVDASASGTYTQVVQCTQTVSSSTSSYMIDSGSAGVFIKGSNAAYFDDVAIANL